MIDCYADRDWAGVVELLADAYEGGDRRRVANIGRRQGRDAALAQMQTMADLGVSFVTPDVIAVRGDRLVLSRGGWSGPDQRSDAFRIAALTIVEIDTEERIVARVIFDPDAIDAAFDELETRYLAGEAARYSAMWSVISQGYAPNSLRIVNLGAEFSSYVASPHEALSFYIPRTVLNGFADDAGRLLPISTAHPASSIPSSRIWEPLCYRLSTAPTKPALCLSIRLRSPSRHISVIAMAGSSNAKPFGPVDFPCVRNNARRSIWRPI